MHSAQSLVALLDRIDNDAEGHLVVDPLQRDLLHHQLLVDGIDVFGPADDPHRYDLVGRELAMQHLDDLVDVGLALGQGALEMGGQVGVLDRKEVLESQVLQLPLQPLDTDAAGQRRVEVHGLAGLDAPVLFIDAVQGKHVLQSVGQTHQQHPDVGAHGQEQFADVLCLVGQLGVVTDVGDAGGAVDDVGDISAEQLFQFLLGGDLFLERAMQQARDNGVEVELHRRER